jgi:uncharacterized repeat protein (TIGR03803 family)
MEAMRKLNLFLCCAALAGCSQETVNALPIAAQGNGNATHESQHLERSFAQLLDEPAGLKYFYDFKNTPDGANPEAGLTNVNGTLYGTTSQGGTRGAGTVFKLTPGTETVLYSFQYGSDGAYPQAALLNVGGRLYGTTSSGGGSSGFGTVFSIAQSGNESVLHRFTGAPDGRSPTADLINVGGTLLGTTAFGGSSCASQDGCGTVFKITPAGKESVVYSFSGSPDGATPTASLLYLNGTLYGTTERGGGSDAGTVFKISPSGTESVLHSFGARSASGGADGAAPTAGLTLVDGALFGTTATGGATGNGTVFKIALTGEESVIYSFKGAPDGQQPEGGLIDVKGALYGTTAYGGSGCNGGFCGAVYEVSPSGRERIIYNFKGGLNGAPSGNLVDVGGALYGTAFQYMGIVYGIAIK